MRRSNIAQIFLFVILCLIVAGCGGPKVAPTRAAQAPAAGFTPGSVCKVPNVVGTSQAAAEAMIAGTGLQPVKSVQHDPNVAAGNVISQNPPAGTRLEPCKEDVTFVVSLGPLPEPSATRAPTHTPEPTKTPTPVPPTSIPTSDLRLFWDDFETGIKPEWKASGNNYSATNGRLILENGLWETSVMGGGGWHSYEIAFHEWWLQPGFKTVQVQVRVQDNDNYMLLKGVAEGNQQVWQWYKVIKGQEQPVPGTRFGGYYFQGPAHWVTKVQVQNNVYRTFVDGEQNVYFVDDTFTNGGFRLKFNGVVSLGGIQVQRMP